MRFYCNCNLACQMNRCEVILLVCQEMTCPGQVVKQYILPWKVVIQTINLCNVNIETKSRDVVRFHVVSNHLLLHLDSAVG